MFQTCETVSFSTDPSQKWIPTNVFVNPLYAFKKGASLSSWPPFGPVFDYVLCVAQCQTHLLQLHSQFIESHLKRFVSLYRDQGCLPFTWKTWKFQLENQMVHIIPFGVLLKLWVSGQTDALLLLLLGFTADVHTYILHVIHLLLRQAKSFRIYAENFHPGALRKW